MANDWRQLADLLSGSRSSSSSANTSTSSSAKTSSPTGSSVSSQSSSDKSGSNSWRSLAEQLSGSRKQTYDDHNNKVAQRVITRAKEKQEEEEKKKRKWFEKGLFEDGYDFGDVTKTILGTTADVLENVGSGIIGMGEKAVDALAYIAPYAENAQFYQNGGGYNPEIQKQHEKAVEQSKTELQKFIAKDLYDEQKVARAIISDPARKIGIDSETQSVFGEKSDALIQSGGQLLATAGMAAAGLPWWATTGVTSFGSEAENAMNQGATYEAAGASAAISAGAEILSEKLSGGISFGGKTLDDALTKQLARGISNKLGRTAAKLGMDMVGEGAEEVFSQIASNVGSSLYKEENLKELLTSEEAMEEYLESFIGGAALGGVAGSYNAVKSNRSGVDYTSGLTENEQKVVDKLYKDEIASREKEGKVSQKEKSKIYDSILEDMEKGYISTDTIEEVLGGEKYSQYKQVAEWEDSLQTEFDTLNKMKQGDMTGEQVDRREALRTQLKNVKATSTLAQQRTQIRDEVMGLVKGDRLAESYNERARTGQKFEADVTKYDAKQQAVVQKAIDSGILNNSNRTHEFVDFVSKISADTGVLFDFSNTAKIREAGFAVEGQTVDGFITKDGITVNIDSPKSRQFVVGHEITHALEGTELYDALRKSVFDYAKMKNQYGVRMESIQKRYKEGTDFEAELTADLVGEYIFSDTDFINNLSTQNRNVFQKVYDEIKYLCKVATAGSKEARELEKVKRAFEKAYREGGKTQGDTKYSLGYHAGDLGKSESYFQQGGGRSTGHFGTGTYFVGNKAAVEGYNKRDGKPAPVETVEFDNYNLYKVYRDETGYKLHDSLHEVDRGFSQDYLNAAVKDKFRASELRSEAWKLGEKYEVKEMDEELGFEMTTNFYEAGIRAMTEVAEANNIEFRTYDEHLEYIGEEAKPGDEDYDLYQDEYYDYLKKLLEEADEDRNYGYSRFRDAHWELRMMFGKDNVNRALQAVLDHDAVMENADYDTMSVSDSRATVFMKALGYEGIDVRGTRLDNTTYGSVIYDLKGEDAKRKAEIGTAKYSLSDSDGKQLTKEQQEYFKDSKARDENGSLKLVYHSSPTAGFTMFDGAEGKGNYKYGDYADGVTFFTDNKAMADSYSPSSEKVDTAKLNNISEAQEWLDSIGAIHLEMREVYGEYEVFDTDEDMVVRAYDSEEELLRDLKRAVQEEYGDPNAGGQYEGYVNLKNPLIVDAEGRPWNRVTDEFSQEVYDKFQSLTEEERAALIDLAEWEDFGLFRKEISDGADLFEMGRENDHTRIMASIAEKMYDTEPFVDPYQLFDVAADAFSEEVVKEKSTIQLSTNDYVERALQNGSYDGVIIKNVIDYGGHAHSTLNSPPGNDYIVFNSNQFKAADNLKPTEDADIRYSLGEVTEEQNQKGLDSKSEVSFSLSNDTAYMNRAITRNNASMQVDSTVLEETKALRERIAARMNAIKDRGLVGLPEDIEGNTYIANSSYDGTEENTTICPRSLASEAFVDAVSEYLGRPLTVNEQIYISQDLQGRSLTPECTYCYVATDRKAYRAFLGEYVAQRDSVLQKVRENPNTDVSRSGELYKQFLNGRKDTNPMYSRFKMWVDAYKNGKPMIDASHLANINKLMGDINSEFGAELKPQIVDAMKYAQSASWAKKRVNYVAYNGHILNWKQDRINKLNSHYGLRMYSFSDFHPAFVLENMQMITDASVRGLKMLGYTKDTDFVDIFAPSGMNINVSTFGFEAGGEVFENNLIGAEWEKAKALREQYPNVGITFVATNDTLVNWALDQDWIDVVIPYHLVRTGAEVAKAFNYTNYTSESSDTKTKDWKKGDQKYIAPTEHNNDKATYLAALAKNNLKPRFERFLENPNYMKLVNECRQPASVSKPVQPVFNEDAAMVALAKLEANGYYQPIGGSVDRMYEIAGEVADAMTNELAPAMSLSNYGEQHTPDSLSALRLDAPVAENATTPTVEENSIVQPETQLTEENSTLTAADMQELFPNNAVPVQEELEQLVYERDQIYKALEVAIDRGSASEVGKLAEEYEDLNARIKALESTEAERTGSITDADAPVEMDAPFYGESSEQPAPDDPFYERDISDVGKRSVKAYQYENPEVKPFFQEAALGMLYDVANTTKGEKWYNDQLYYDSGGEKGFGGTKRSTTPDIAELKDVWGYTYDQIEKGLNAIIEDDGKENNAVSKRIEFMLNDRLLKGYTDIDGRPYEPNQDYIRLLNEKQITEYSKEAFDSFMLNADQYAPPAEDFAPVKPLSKATPDTMDAPIFESKDKNAVKGQTTMFEPEKPNPRVARVLTEESKPREKQGIGMEAVSSLVDKGMVFENLSLDTGNMEVQAKWNSALPAYTEKRAQYFMEKGAEGVKPLKEIIKDVKKTGKEEAFSDYMYHVHNIDRMSLEDRFGLENKAVFGDTVTAEVSTKKVQQYEKANPEFKAIAESVYEYNKYLRGLLVENGVISQETADLWEKEYPHYVPVRRVDQKGKNISVPLDTNKTGVNAPVKRATGGSSDIEPLFNTMAMRTEQVFSAIARNRFGIELKNTLDSTINTQKNATGVDEAINLIEDQESNLLKPGTLNSNPTFTVFENGERVEFEITEDMYDALKPAGKLLGHRNEKITKVSNWRRNLLTTWNPVFALWRNPVKDLQDVMINSQHAAKTYAQIVTPTKDNVIWQIWKNGEWAREYESNGGKGSTYFDSKNKKFTEEDNIFKKTIGFPLNKLEAAGEFIEEIPRLAEYIASRKEGRSVDRSMLDAARVTTNFAAGGDVTRFANAHGFTFLNASVQGASQHVRNFREATRQDGMKGFVKTLAKYTLAGIPGIILNNMVWGDDEEYEELSDYVKQNYYVVWKTQDGKFFRIPKGRTAAVMNNALEQMQHLVTGDDEADFSTFFELFMNNIAPNNPIDNNILAPIGQALNNKAWYGDDLVPTRLQDLPAEEQFDESTDALSKIIGEKTGTSPYKWNYLIDQYSGGLGDMLLPMATPEAESGDNSFVGNLFAPWKKEMTTDSVLNNKNPGNFYDLKDELEVVANGKNATEEDKMRSMYLDSVSWEMGDLYAQKREIQSSDLPDDQKYAKVREIQEQINELANNALDKYNNVRINGAYSETGDRRYNYDADKDKWYEIKPTNSDGSDNWYYIQEQLSHDKLGMSYDDFWNGKQPPDGGTYYAEYNGKRYNYDAGKSQWYEIMAKNDDGSDNRYYQKEQEVTKGLGISYEEYWSKPKEYNFAYEKPGQYAVAQAVGGYDSYKEHYDVLKNSYSDNYLRADKDKYGNTIDGSRKQKVLDYINGLDIDYGERIILYRTVYSSKSDKRKYNQDIIDYLNERDDISYDEMKSILEELDMEVDEKGNITW